MKLEGARVLITGTTRGMGKDFAICCARQGGHLILVNRRKDSNAEAELIESGAKSVQQFEVDLANRKMVEDFCTTLQTLEIDVLINNAGLLTGGLIEEQSVQEIQNMFEVNLISLIQLTRAVVPGMVKRRLGMIVNNSSVSAIMHFPCASTYAAAKAAVWAFSNSLRLELASANVKVLTLITPGIKTEMFDDIEKRYGKNLEVPTDSISSIQYANEVVECIINDQEFYWPKGMTRFGLFAAKYLPGLFRKAVVSKFSRTTINKNP